MNSGCLLYYSLDILLLHVKVGGEERRGRVIGTGRVIGRGRGRGRC